MDGALAKVVVDPEDVGLHEGPEEDPIQLSRRGEVLAEGLLDDDPGAVRAARSRQLLHDRSEERRRNREVVGRVLGAGELAPERLERRRILVVAVDVAEQPAQRGEGVGVEAAVLLDALSRPRLQLIEVPTRLGHADDRHVEVAALGHRLQRRKDLLEGQIAGRAEKDERVGLSVAHAVPCSQADHFVDGFFVVAAELEAHRREQLVLERRFSA